MTLLTFTGHDYINYVVNIFKNVSTHDSVSLQSQKPDIDSLNAANI